MRGTQWPVHASADPLLAHKRIRFPQLLPALIFNQRPHRISKNEKAVPGRWGGNSRISASGPWHDCLSAQLSVELEILGQAPVCDNGTREFCTPPPTSIRHPPPPSSRSYTGVPKRPAHKPNGDALFTHVQEVSGVQRRKRVEQQRLRISQPILLAKQV